MRGVLTPAVVSRGGEIDENSKLSKEMLGKALSNMGKTLSDQEVALRPARRTPFALLVALPACRLAVLTIVLCHHHRSFPTSSTWRMPTATAALASRCSVQRCRYNFRSTPRSLTSLYDTLQEFCVVSSMPEESHMDLARCAIAEFIGVALFQVRSSTCSCRC